LLKLKGAPSPKISTRKTLQESCVCISIFNGAIKKTADEDKSGDSNLKSTFIISREEKVEKMIQQRLLEQERLRIKIDYKFLTVKERSFQFIREKEKGDEYFRCKEFDKSYLHYSRSIAFDSRNPIVYANRAMSSIKLSNLNDALLDWYVLLHLRCLFESTNSYLFYLFILITYNFN